MDVTTDQLQTTTAAKGTTGSVEDILSKLYPMTNTATANYGWYIKLDQNSGEKVLSVPLIFNKVAYFTTHAPSTSVSSDPCLAKDDLGTSRMYAMNYKTGEAVLNFDTTNDSSTTYSSRAKSGGIILLRSDRVTTLGPGISSGVGVIITPGGETELIVGDDKKLVTKKAPPGGGIKFLYWGRNRLVVVERGIRQLHEKELASNTGWRVYNRRIYVAGGTGRYSYYDDIVGYRFATISQLAQ